MASGSRRSISRFRELSWADRLLLIEAGLLVAGVRVALRSTSLTRLRMVVDRLGRRRGTSAGRSAERIAWATEVAGRHVPGGDHCLSKALGGQILMRRAGHPARLRIGLARGEGRRLHGHAWLESGDRIVVGGNHPNVEALPPWDPA